MSFMARKEANGATPPEEGTLNFDDDTLKGGAVKKRAHTEQNLTNYKICTKYTLEEFANHSPAARDLLYNYILIRYPAQTNIKHLSCNKQPQLGCVNTSRVRPSLLCLHQQNGWK